MSIKDDVLKNEKFANSSDPIDRYFTERAAMLLSKHFAKWMWKPNFISILSLLTGIIGSTLFIPHNIYINILGCLIFIFSYVLDCCDGQVARMTHQSSLNGRFIDGCCDGLVYASAYVCISIRLMDTHIPFTNTYWSYFIFLVFIIIGVWFHAPQCRIVDNTRNFHMFILTNGKKHEFSDVKTLLEEKETYKTKKKDLSYFRVVNYLSYTKAQEKSNIYMYRLVNIIRDNNLDVKDEVIEELTKRFKPWFVQLTTCYTFNIRTYPLILFILLSFDGYYGMPILYVVYTLVILEPLKWIFKIRYERFAKEMSEKYYSQYIK